MIEPNRRTGRSTRMVDEAIQTLFKSGKVTVQDHYDTEKTHFYLLRRVLSRLQNEHRVRVSTRGLTITLLEQ